MRYTDPKRQMISVISHVQISTSNALISMLKNECITEERARRVMRYGAGKGTGSKIYDV